MKAYLTRYPAADVYSRKRGDSLAKHAVAFSWDVPLLWHPRQIALEATDLVSLRIDLVDYLRSPRKLLLPHMGRLGAAPKRLGHLAHRIASILDLRDCIASLWHIQFIFFRTSARLI
jgi:hypothetical protein